MPRIRTVKPEFFTHPEIASLSIPARLLLVSLWTLADDSGRMYDQPLRIRAHAFGETDKVNIAKLLDELEDDDRILRYSAAGRSCLYVTGFTRHQAINRPSPSSIPAPPEEAHGAFTEDSHQERKGTGNRERKGKDVAIDPDFVKFWSVYPRHDDRLDALKAWEKARLLAPVEDIIAAAQGYGEDPNRDDGYTKLGATWLNKRCWDNPPLPERSRTPADAAAAERDRIFARKLDEADRLIASERETR